MKRAFLTGALVGMMLTAALTAIFFLVEQLMGLPFVPFDVLDWFARVEQLGGLITFGIGALVTVITALGGEVASAAKPAEQMMAVGGLLVTGMAVSAALFGLLRRRGAEAGRAAGLAAGAVVGLPVTLISHSLNRPDVLELLINTAWIMGAFLAWGAALAWVYRQLYAPAWAGAAPATEVEPAPALRIEGGASAQQSASAALIDRRTFLIRLGGATAVITVAGAGLGGLLAAQRESRREALPEWAVAELPEGLPNADDPLIPAPGTRPEYTPLDRHYRIDINARPVEIDGATWRLNINGMVDDPLSLSLDDLRAYPSMDQYVTLSCISNPIAGSLISTTRWTGVSLQRVLADAGVQERARVLNIRSADGFHESLALDLVNNEERVMLTYAWDGEPLRPQHGFPLRVYIPDRFGMKQPKWMTDIEVSEAEVEGYWVRRGWDPVAQMIATSVIDTVAVDNLIEQGGQALVPIGGIAHAGARGISKVEVKVDDGEWVEAALRRPLSDTTWVIWRYDWPFEEGRHAFSVRCAEGDGTPQPTSSPAVGWLGGAAGIHTLRRPF